MNFKNSEELDVAQLVTDDEMRTLILIMLEGAGGEMETKELNAGIEKVSEWARKIRLESAVLECVLHGGLMMRCGSDGELQFRIRIGESGESLETTEIDGPLQ